MPIVGGKRRAQLLSMSSAEVLEHPYIVARSSCEEWHGLDASS
jgi:hypothetical protein